MWICQNCGTENEENFKFCWSCGQTKVKNAPVKEFEPKKEFAKQAEPEKQFVKETKPFEEIKLAEPVKPPKPVQEPELFSTVVPYSAKSSSNLTDEFDWQREVFAIAVRLVGLFLLYQVLVAVPDLVTLIYTTASGANDTGNSEFLTSRFLVPVAKLLFYFIVGVYLIASGRILIWLLPRHY